MNKKEVLASIIEMANEFDAQGAFVDADALTEVGKRLAQWDDEGGGDYDYSDSDRQSELEGIDDYNRFEERELDRDRWLENQEEEGHDSIESAMEEARRLQADNDNVPFIIVVDDEGSFYAMPENHFASSQFDTVQQVPPMTPEEFRAYHDAQRMEDESIYERETPLGMELDDTLDPMEF